MAKVLIHGDRDVVIQWQWCLKLYKICVLTLQLEFIHILSSIKKKTRSHLLLNVVRNEINMYYIRGYLTMTGKVKYHIVSTVKSL
jgi:hypothetical protein